jgi:hypothetical protein
VANSDVVRVFRHAREHGRPATRTKTPRPPRPRAVANSLGVLPTVIFPLQNPLDSLTSASPWRRRPEAPIGIYAEKPLRPVRDPASLGSSSQRREMHDIDASRRRRVPITASGKFLTRELRRSTAAGVHPLEGAIGQANRRLLIQTALARGKFRQSGRTTPRTRGPCHSNGRRPILYPKNLTN